MLGLDEIYQEWDHSRAWPQKSLVQVQAELKLLSVELSMSIDILGKILDSVRVLELSVEEPV